MAVDMTASPYNDRFDSTQNRTRLLFKPDRPLQHSELNELQSINHYFVKTLGDSIFKDGDKQSGMDFTIDSNKTVKVNPGYVYVAGKIRYYNSNSTVTLTGVGKEVVGIKLIERVVTASEDSSLKDQTSGVDSYFSEGADRLVEEMILVLDDPTSAPIYTFQDGEVFVTSASPEMEKINKVLAERTYDESGSYKVTGFDIFSDGTAVDPNNVAVVVDAGKAYVMGYSVNKPVATRLNVPKSFATADAINESTVFNASSPSITLVNSPVKQINRVTGQVLNSKELVTRGAVGDSQDLLKNTTIYEVTRVWTESSPGVLLKEYRQGIDYRLINGQSIDWSLSGVEPNAGTSYYVSYKYNRVMAKDTDYTITKTGTGLSERWVINFTVANGVKPIDQSVVLIDYSYYLARKDTVVLTKEGKVNILPGQPNTLNLVTPPLNTDPNSLQLGTITVFPNSSQAECLSYAVTRLSMEDLQKIKRRVEHLEYNQAVNALDDSAMEGQNPLVLRGVFSEGFIGMEKADVTHPDFNVAFSFEDAEATLSYQEDVKAPVLNTGLSSGHNWGRIVSAPFTEERSIYQGQASETLNVNPYNIPNKQGVLRITPSEDNWIDASRVTITEQKTAKYRMNRFWRHGGTNYNDTERYLFNNLKLDAGQKWEGQSLAFDTKYGRTGTLLEAGGQRTLETMIEFIRQRDITFKVTGLYPNADNLVLLFDGVRCPVTPLSGTSAGTQSGTLRASSTGTAQGKFTIPAGIRCGNREVMLSNADSSATAVYSAFGRKKVTQDIIIKTRVTVNLVDPLAQSFQFLENRIISSVGLYFATKGTANSNVTVQIRAMGDQGFPTKTIYAEKVLNSSEIKTSNNASAETRVYFDDPIMVESGKEYAIVIITESSDYQMWVGTRTKPQIDNPSVKISGNPYPQGVLFSSSNASTWTPRQNSDLKFGIYTANFNKQAVIEFDSLKNVQADRVVLMSTYLTPESTGCVWEAKMIYASQPTTVTIDLVPWAPIGNYQDLELDAVAREFKLRATFISNKYISPLMSVSDLTFTSFLTQLRGSYISRAIDMTEAPFNTLRFSYEAFLPRGTSVIPKYSVDNGATWKTFTKSATSTKANNEFYRYDIDEKITTSTKYTNLKVRLDLATENSFLRPRIRRLMVTARDE